MPGESRVEVARLARDFCAIRDVELALHVSAIGDTLGSQGRVTTGSPLEMAAHTIAITDPSLGLYSPTDAAKRATLTQRVYDGVNGIIWGREDASTLDQLVKDWRSAGGDRMLAEYQQAYASNK